jgi:hypothetical protein
MNATDIVSSPAQSINDYIILAILPLFCGAIGGVIGGYIDTKFAPVGGVFGILIGIILDVAFKIL